MTGAPGDATDAQDMAAPAQLAFEPDAGRQPEFLGIETPSSEGLACLRSDGSSDSSNPFLTEPGGISARCERWREPEH